MSWISDIQSEIKELDVSKNSIRKFAFLVGGIFIIITIWMLMNSFSRFSPYLFSIIGMLLMLAGTFFPYTLKNIYKLWMAMAFTMGWFVSRILVMVIFYLVVMPIGLTARIFGKKFLDEKMEEGRDSYWIKKNTNNTVNYEKMY